MSELRQRLDRLYREGHMGAPPDLWLDPRIRKVEHFKPASVLIAITDQDDPGMLLIHRPANMRAHPGQIAFPGGRREPGEDAVAAALREAEEELGIAAGKVDVIGPTDLYRTGSGYEITPVLALVPPDLAITPNPTEVASWFEAPVDFVLDPTRQVPKEFDLNGQRHLFVEILWQQHRIWGVTAAILCNLSKRLNWHG